MSGLVSAIENIREPVIPCYLFFFSARIASVLRFEPSLASFIGVLVG